MVLWNNRWPQGCLKAGVKGQQLRILRSAVVKLVSGLFTSSSPRALPAGLRWLCFVLARSAEDECNSLVDLTYSLIRRVSCCMLRSYTCKAHAHQIQADIKREPSRARSQSCSSSMVNVWSAAARVVDKPCRKSTTYWIQASASQRSLPALSPCNFFLSFCSCSSFFH